MKWLLKLGGLGAGVLMLVAAGASIGCEWWVARAAKGRCFDEAALVPETPVAVVLGASPRLADGRPNLFFLARMEAAAALFKAGRVKALIVSGDNGTRGYDEPTEMKTALVRLGVPHQRVVCDFAGFRTLDSAVRAKEVFGQDRVVFVSQRFHNERAIYLARSAGMDAHGFNARDVPVAAAPRTFLREKLASVKAVLDVTVLKTRPRFLGGKVAVPLE